MQTLGFDPSEKITQMSAILDKFLADHPLYLSPQAKHQVSVLMARYFLNEDPFEEDLAFNFLNRLMEYRVEKPDDIEDIDQVEKGLIKLICSADAPEDSSAQTRRWIRILAPAALMILLAFPLMEMIPQQNIFFTSQESALEDPLNATINETKAAELKGLVKQVVELEKRRGNDVHHMTVWSKVKKPYNAMSYKRFTQAQFLQARRFLHDWIEQLQQASDTFKKTDTKA